MVHNSKSRIANLTAFILEHVADNKSCFVVSDVKQDGTVFVRFRSVASGTYGASALDLAGRFGVSLGARNLQFVQTDDNKFRLALDQF